VGIFRLNHETSLARAWIELRDIRKSFGRHEVLRGITANVAKGEVVCIIGPSGSGKSMVFQRFNPKRHERSNRRVRRNRPARGAAAAAGSDEASALPWTPPRVSCGNHRVVPDAGRTARVRRWWGKASEANLAVGAGS
jgi:energy-coupling factor transporter ATP-binding protein EcfA2